MAIMVTYDEPGFIGQVLETAGEIVCVVASTATTDRVIQARVRRLMSGQGIDCQKCRSCIIGQAQL
jgi:acyl-CoA reductase-like NAD-dependent aldehyde dehydrogenase